MIDQAITLLDWLGVVAFATTGSLAAARKRMDVFGFILLGTATGIGGGTIRDSVLGATPVFWITHPSYLLACVAVSCGVFFLAHIPASREALLLKFDAIGLALFAVLGADRTMAMAGGPIAAVAMGVVTATFGGVIRDILSGETPAILSRDVYASAALAGASVFVVILEGVAAREIAIIAGFLVAATIRFGALHWRWSLPRYGVRKLND